MKATEPTANNATQPTGTIGQLCADSTFQQFNDSTRRKASMFENLPDVDQQLIIDLCREHTYDKVVHILAQPRPAGLALNTSVSSLSRFYTRWNPEAKQARLMEQLGKTLRVRRQASPGAAITGILAILENNLLNQLSRGKAVTDLTIEFNTYLKAHRAWLGEEKNNHALGSFDARADYWKHQVDLDGGDADDFDYNDRPREDGCHVRPPDDFTPEDQDREDVENFFRPQGAKLHVPLNAESYDLHIVQKLPILRPPLAAALSVLAKGVAPEQFAKSGEISEFFSPQSHAISHFAGKNFSDVENPPPAERACVGDQPQHVSSARSARSEGDKGG